MGYFKDQATEKMIDPAKSRKGKNSRARGNAFEREVAKRLLGQRVDRHARALGADARAHTDD